MQAFIVTIIVGLVCIAIGVSNRKGNIHSLHSYHRSRVKEEDRIPFGKQVGLGMIVVGIGIVIYGALSLVSLKMDNTVYMLIGTAIMIAGLVTGLGIAFAAMKKYNGGIF